MAIYALVNGDLIHVWIKICEHCVRLVVEDTGPSIPKVDLGKVFGRFDSGRLTSDFDIYAGLDLAISKQITNTHIGIIWAENILPMPADAASEALAARLVVGLPV